MPEKSEKWRRLSDNQSLAQLHAKFWGKTWSMAEEEEAWRVRQHSTSNPSESEDDDDDDDIKPGCYFLDIDNEAIKMRSIWIRVSVFRMVEISTCFTNLTG
jgi:hypothetical protein